MSLTGNRRHGASVASASQLFSLSFSCEFHPIIYHRGNEAKLKLAKNSANTLIGSASYFGKGMLVVSRHTTTDLLFETLSFRLFQLPEDQSMSSGLTT